MRMMKKLLPIAVTAIMIMIPATGIASAETLPATDPGWQVSYTSAGEIQSNFSTGNLDETISTMQPGDEAHFSINVSNESSSDTEWYLENTILYSMEDRSANSGTEGGAYTYKLSFTDANGEETVYFDSNAGGEGTSPVGEGLHEATNGQQGWFHLGALNAGKNGTVDLVVALDGETQGNNYQDTLADLQLRFAVETVKPGSKEKVIEKNVKTGDDFNAGFYVALCLIAGTLLLILAIASLISRKREEGGR